MLPAALLLSAACSNADPGLEEEDFSNTGQGVFILCEGNFNAGNSTLSYYQPTTGQVENGIFARANDRKLGDTGQSIAIYDGTAYIAVENSGIIWAIDTATFRVKGQLTTGGTQHMINPRYIHFLSSEKAYVTDLYSPYITIFNPRTMTCTGSISTRQESAFGYFSTEKLVAWGHYVFTNCWSYSNKILVIDTRSDQMVHEIELGSWQPKDMTIDSQGKLWVITDGGYSTGDDSFGDNIPHLYRIDAESFAIEQDFAMDTDEGNVQLAMNTSRDTLYLINNDIYRMAVTDPHPPVRPFIHAELGQNGRRHFLYAIGVHPRNGEIYVADAVDYSQSGVVFRYSSDGRLIDKFRVGITPNGFAFK